MWKTVLNFGLLSLSVLVLSCQPGQKSESPPSSNTSATTVLDILTHRYYQEDQALFQQFAASADVQINVKQVSSDSLWYFYDPAVTDLVISQSVLDLNQLLANDELGVFSTGRLDEQISSYYYRDKGGKWIGLTRRTPAFVFNRGTVNPADIKSYLSLADPKWKGALMATLTSNSAVTHITAAMLAAGKTEEAEIFAQGVLGNLVLDTPNSDWEIVQAVAAGDAEVGIIFASNHILGHMSGNPEFFKVGEATSVLYPLNSEGKTYVDLSCAAISNQTPVRRKALNFLEFLSSETGQTSFAGALHEYPTNVLVLPTDFLINLGGYREAKIEPHLIAENQATALSLLNQGPNGQ